MQSAAQTRSVTAQAFKELPSGGSWIQMAALVPAVRASNTDVGGVLGDQTGAQVSAHGSHPRDGVSLIDGMRIGNMYLSSNLTNMSLSPLLFDQVNVQMSGQMAETGTNGVIMNAIPRSGGNRFSGSALANGSGPACRAQPHRQPEGARRAGASSTLKTLYDINGAVGGPIKQDKLWFYATSRYFTNEYYLAASYYPVDVTAVTRDERPVEAGVRRHLHVRQQRPRHVGDQREAEDSPAGTPISTRWIRTGCSSIFNASPEAARITTWHTQLSTTKWTYAATNKVLFEAGVAAGASPDTIKADLKRVGSARRRAALRRRQHRRSRRPATSLPRADRLRLRRPPAVADRSSAR